MSLREDLKQIMARQPSPAGEEAQETRERERLHVLIADLHAALDPMQYPELAARCEVELSACTDAECKPPALPPERAVLVKQLEAGRRTEPMLSGTHLETVRKVLLAGGYQHIENANSVIRMLLADIEALRTAAAALKG